MRLPPAALGVLAIVTITTVATAAGEHPAELDGGTDCTLWKGTVSGNDPTVRMMFRLCPGGGDAIAGTAQWSSKVSGYNVRRLSGRWLDHGARLELRDEAVIEQHPEPGWRFCTIDRYELARTGDVLSGTYDSSACNDHATVKVSLVAGQPPAQSSASASLPPPSVPSAPALIDTKPRTSSKGCGCSIPGRPGAPSGGLVAVVAIAISRAVSRRKVRARR